MLSNVAGKLNNYVSLLVRASNQFNIVLKCSASSNVRVSYRYLSNRFQYTATDKQYGIVSLRSKIIKEHFLRKPDIETYLLEPQNYGEGFCSLLLQCCTDFLPSVTGKDKLQFAKHVWEIFEKSGYNFTLEDTHKLLEVYIATRQPLDDVPWLDPTILSDKRSLLLVLQCAAETGDHENITETLLRMKQLNIALTEETFAPIILCHSRRHDYKSAVSVLQSMKDADIEKGLLTYIALLQAQIENEQAITQTVKQIMNFDGLTESHLTKLIYSIAISKRENLLPTVMHMVHFDKLNIEMKNTVLELIYEGYNELALRIIAENPIAFGANEMPSNFATFFIRELVASNKKDDVILNFCKQLTSIFPNHESFLLSATEASLRDVTKTQLSIELLKNVTPLRNHYFWPLIVRAKNISVISEVLKLMTSLNLKIDFDTLAYYVFSNLLKSDTPINLLQILQRDCNLTVTTLLGPLILALLNAKLLNEAVILCKQYKTRTLDVTQLIKPLMSATLSERNITLTATMLSILKQTKQLNNKPIDIVGSFLVEYSNKCPTRDLEDLLKLLSKQKMRISLHNYESLIARPSMKLFIPLLNSITDSSYETSNNSLPLPHPKEMSVEELEGHLVELKSKGLNTRGVLRKLLHYHCRLNNAQRVMEIRDELEAEHCELSAGILSSLLAVYLNSKDIINATSTLQQINTQYQSFKLDEYKIIDYCSLLAESGEKEDEIKKILNEFVIKRQKQGEDIMGGRQIKRNCDNFVKTVEQNLGMSSAENLSQCLKSLKFVQ